MKTKTQKHKAPADVITALDKLRERLLALSSPEDNACGVPKEAKEAARLYLTTWCLPLVDHVNNWSRGEEREQWLIDSLKRGHS